MRFPATLSLHTRISLVLTALAASLLLVLASLWLHGARSGIHEEIEAASRVSAQWLKALTGDLQEVPAADLPVRLVGMLKPLGRIRANGLEILGEDGHLLYRAPPPTYKAGRTVPDWFAGLLAVDFAPRTLVVGQLQIVLKPDASRSQIDAWDDLCAMSGWALALLALLFVSTRFALDRALRPLALVMQALDQTGSGRFDTRLPVFATPELGRISRAFNGMADRLIAAVNDNVRLETEREVDSQMQARLEAERRLIARDLHDELAQGITAVRALAGAIVQRTAAQPALQMPAQSIVAVTSDMQEGVKGILHRLRPPASSGLSLMLQRTLTAWQVQHEEIMLCQQLALGEQTVSDALAQAVIRIVQEGLTNVVRHARASRVEVCIRRTDGGLQVSIGDNGCGNCGQASPQAGSGLGLKGMAERVAGLGGTLTFDRSMERGFRLLARLPDQPAAMILEELK